jgi:hypothetical protein
VLVQPPFDDVRQACFYIPCALLIMHYGSLTRLPPVFAFLCVPQVLVQPPFDDVRQACFYIPWALLQSDDFAAAVAARKEYVEFIDHVHALATIALKAADGEPGADMQVGCCK